jgi:hypothetical protein
MALLLNFDGDLHDACNGGDEIGLQVPLSRANSCAAVSWRVEHLKGNRRKITLNPFRTCQHVLNRERHYLLLVALSIVAAARG